MSSEEEWEIEKLREVPTPAVSIIIPLKDEEVNSVYPLESIKAQTFKDYEVIVVDGESTDKTVEVCRQYADIVIHQPGKPYAAPGEGRNFAQGIARGKYLAFIEAGHSWEPDYLETMVKTLEDNPEEPVAFCGMLIELPTKTLQSGPWLSWNDQNSPVVNFILNNDLDILSMLIRREESLSWKPYGKTEEWVYLVKLLSTKKSIMIVNHYYGIRLRRTLDAYWEIKGSNGRCYSDYTYHSGSAYAEMILTKMHTLHAMGSYMSLFYYWIFSQIERVTAPVQQPLAKITAKCYAQFLQDLKDGAWHEEDPPRLEVYRELAKTALTA
jgi:glycosyltransferase involved in cell wall biosynthesis